MKHSLETEHFLHATQHQLNEIPRFNRWMASVLNPYVGARVLEIGSGMGNLSAELCGREFYVATDVDPYFCGHLSRRFAGRSNMKVAKVDITGKGDFAQFEGSMDTVLCLNVIEHLDDDQSAIRNMRRVLQLGGRLVLLVPQGPALYGTLDELFGHRRRYRQADLCRILESSGFTIEKTMNFNRISTPAWFINGKILRRRYFGQTQLKIFDSLIWLLRRIDCFLPWSGQSLIVVARKS